MAIEVSSYLGGGVVLSTLPLLTPPTPADAPVLKRIDLPQGELAQIYDSDDGLRYAAVIELVAGTVRGNHYHKIKREHVYLIRGSLELIVEDIVTKVRAVLEVPTGSSVLIRPGVAHALRTLDPGFAVEFSVDRYAAEDTFRFPLV